MTLEPAPGTLLRFRLSSGDLACLAALAIAAALTISHGMFHPVALALVTVAAALSMAAIWQRGDSTGRWGWWNLRHLLFVALVASCLWHVIGDPGWFFPGAPTSFRGLAILALLIATSYARPIPPRLARWRFALLASCFVGMASAVVIASPSPRIDVWWFQQLAARAFLGGDNPYGITYPNLYGHSAFYGQSWIENGRIVVFPYLPLTFLVEAPGVAVFGDVRLVLILLTVAAAALLRAAARSEAGELAALLVLLQPRTFFVVEQAWTEPLVLACLALLLVSLRRAGRTGGWLSAGIACGLLAVSKQYAPLLVIPFLAVVPKEWRWRWSAVALLSGCAVLVPFVVWDARAFWRDTVLAQPDQPFRMDALSWLVPVAARLGRPVSAAWGFAAASLALAASARRPPSLARAACVGGSALLLLVLFNKQAFCNYYWLCSGVLLGGGALWSERETESPEDAVASVTRLESDENAGSRSDPSSRQRG